MKQKITLVAMTMLFLMQSCKKAEEWINSLEDQYWQNVENVLLSFGGDEAYIVDAGNSNLESNPSVFDPSTTPYIRNLSQTGAREWKGEIIRTTSSNGTITTATYQSTTITLSEENGKKIIRFSNADANTASWTAHTDTNTGGGTVVVRDTTSVVTYDTSMFCNTGPMSPGNYTFKPVTVRSGWKKLTSANGYVYRMYAHLSSGGASAELYFNEKPTANKTYNVVSGSGAHMIGVGSNEVGLVYNVYTYGVKGAATVSVKTSGGKITVEGASIPAQSTTAADVLLTFKFIGQ